MAAAHENSLEQISSPGEKAWFVFMLGRVNLHSSKIQLYTRVGVEGVGLVDTAKRGAPFRLTMLNFVKDHQQAKTVLEYYLDTFLSGPAVRMVRVDEPQPDIFHVLNVEENVAPRTIKAVCGGVPPPFDTEESLTVRHETVWTLINAPDPNPTPPA